MKGSTSIDWTVSSSDSSKPVEDKSEGKLTCTKLEGFTYNSPITVVGVNVQSGISVTETVTVGLAQAVDSIDFVGFVSKNDKTKILDTLPADFAPNTYSLLYKTKDQNGNPVSMSFDEGSYIKNGYLTFMSNAPTLVDTTMEDDVNYTIGDIEYAAVKINPGQYADKGGDVTIKAISNKTGNFAEKTYTINAGGLLQSLVLEAPSKVVADGDQNVKLNYTAKDTNGNPVTSYETIVRSTNKLTLNATDGTLTVKEENNGDAGIYWSDNVKYTAEASENPYSQSGITDGINRSVSLSTIVVGGESSSLMLNVSDMRRPDAIQSVDEAESNTIVSGSGLGTAYTNKDYGTKYLDQYGEVLDNVLADKFFTQGKEVGINGKLYGIQIERSKNAPVYDYPTGLNIILTADVNNPLSGWVWGGNVRTDEKTQFVTKYSIVSKSTAADATWASVSKVKSVTYTAVPLSDVKDFTITDTASKYKLTTDNSGNANGNSLSNLNTVAEGSLDLESANANVFKVKGVTKDGVTVTVPKQYVSSLTDDVITSFGLTGATATEVLSGISSDGNNLVVTAVSSGAIKWNELYDENTAKATRIDATKTLKVFVTDAASSSAVTDNTVKKIVSKDITMSDALSVVASLTFGTNANPANTNLTAPIAWSDIRDQYGMAVSGKTVTYKVSAIEESKENLTHMINSFNVNDDGTSNISITGAEIGDKYTITATVSGTKVSASNNVTIGADTYAYISSNDNKEFNDEALRKTLGYNR